MRGLTPKQRSLLLKEWRRLHASGIVYPAREDIPPEIYEMIEDVHPTEIHWQNVGFFFEKENNKERARRIDYRLPFGVD